MALGHSSTNRCCLQPPKHRSVLQPDPPCMEYLPMFTIDLSQMSVNMCKMNMLVILKVCRKTHKQLFGALLLDVEFPTFVCLCVLLFIAFALNLAAGKLVSPQNEPLDTKSHDFWFDPNIRFREKWCIPYCFMYLPLFPSAYLVFVFFLMFLNPAGNLPKK